MRQPKDDLDDDTAAEEAARSALADEIVVAKSREFKTLGVVLRSHYANSPINADEDTPLPDEHTSDYRPCARPGCLAPHAWLADGSSLYDHFGQAYSLLLLHEGRILRERDRRRAESNRRAAEAA
ncbi:MAG: hypothetical protein JO134_18950 [Xanthobacteraceae bacterium]|nr:hypothetical protein [Xanthobacteraceae bacterium]